ncbi:MAG: hypothetical protein ACHBN1_03985 [Heteroscytonema crispum UTEX LB 1556]
MQSKVDEKKMIKIKQFLPTSRFLSTSLNLLALGFIVALATTTTPASAQQLIIIDRGAPYQINQQPVVGSFIYGSPIPTPMPVNPSTGLMPIDTGNTYYSYPQVRQNVTDSTLFNPILVNPYIGNSTLVNPVIVNDASRHRPLKGRSRVILTFPR